MKTLDMKVLVLVTLLAVLAAACTQQQTLIQEEPASPQPATVDEEVETVTEESKQTGWRDAEFTDTRTGKKFRISDFKGKKVLMESFAVWCPVCLKQQQELKKITDDVVHVSLDTDPNEDVALVKEHADKYGFDWYFTISPPEVTQDLIDEFGRGIVSAPMAPIVLICEDGSSRFLGRGLKLVEELEEELAKGC